MRTVFTMEVIDPIVRSDGTRYVRRFTFPDREEAWAAYNRALCNGFEATVEEVTRMRERVKV